MNAEQRWKLAVLEAYNWTCQNCGTVKHLDAAHIESKGRRPDLALDPANGVTLCRNCHFWYHQCPEMWNAFVQRWRRCPHQPLCGDTLTKIALAPVAPQGSRKRHDRRDLFTDAWVRQQNSR